MYTVYGGDHCTFCKQAVETLQRYQLPYQYRSTEDQEVLNELKLRKPDVRTIPQIWWDDQYVGGFDRLVEQIENTIGGYGEGKL